MRVATVVELGHSDHVVVEVVETVVVLCVGVSVAGWQSTLSGQSQKPAVLKWSP